MVQEGMLRLHRALDEGREDRVAGGVPLDDRHPPRDRRAALGACAPGALRRRLAARAASDRRGETSPPGTPRWPTRSRSRSWSCSRASRPSSARSSCFARSSTTRSRRSPRSSASREPAVRKLAERARGHVGEGRRRYSASREERDELARRFFAAAEEGDVKALEDAARRGRRPARRRRRQGAGARACSPRPRARRRGPWARGARPASASAGSSWLRSS